MLIEQSRRAALLAATLVLLTPAGIAVAAITLALAAAARR
jgi:hypothetical protein